MDRIGTEHGTLGIQYKPESYLPFGLYSNEMQMSPHAFLFVHLSDEDADGTRHGHGFSLLKCGSD
jgi:hypothetical protein